LEKYSKGPVELEGGLRFDLRSVQTCEVRQIMSFNKQIFNYQNSQPSLEDLFSAAALPFPLSSNLGSAWRPPNVNELFQSGNCIMGLPAIEIGDPNLNSEKSFKWVNELEIWFPKTTPGGHWICQPDQITFTSIQRERTWFKSPRDFLMSMKYLAGYGLFLWIWLCRKFMQFTDNLSGYAKGCNHQSKNTDENNLLPFHPLWSNGFGE